jgi:hypothetical protein
MCLPDGTRAPNEKPPIAGISATEGRFVTRVSGEDRLLRPPVNTNRS